MSPAPKGLASGVHWIGALDSGLREFDIILKTANGTTYGWSGEAVAMIEDRLRDLALNLTGQAVRKVISMEELNRSQAHAQD